MQRRSDCVGSCADSIGHGGTCPHFYKWLGTRGTVSRTTNKKLTKLYWLSGNRSPKRYIVLLEPKKWRGTIKKFFSGALRPTGTPHSSTGPVPHFQIRSGATVYVPQNDGGNNVTVVDWIQLRSDCVSGWLFVDFGNMDSQRSFFVESGRRATRYIRVVRIGFVKPFDGRDVVIERPIVVNYVTFEPLMLSSGGIFGIPLFESMAQTMKRAIDWLQTVDSGCYAPLKPLQPVSSQS